jgi:predicted Zn-dependent protease
MPRGARKIDTQLLETQITRQFVKRGLARVLYETDARWTFKIVVRGNGYRRFQFVGSLKDAKAAAIAFAQSVPAGVGIILDDGK